MRFNKRTLAGVALGAFALSFGVAACGGDDSSGGGGSDEKYVANMCKAVKDFGVSFADISSKAATAKSEDDVIKLLVAPLENVAKAFKNAGPPSDIKDAHNAAVKQLDEAVADVKKNGAKSTKFANFETPKLSPAASARLDAVAAKNQDCKDADFNFGSQ